MSERAALHVVITSNNNNKPAVSSSPRADPVDPMYAVLASADLAVILAVSLGAVLVAIAVIVALVFLASRRRRRDRQFQLRRKETEDAGRNSGSSPFTRPGGRAGYPAGIALNGSPPGHLLANGGKPHLLQRASSSASGRQLNVAFSPDVNIELEV